MDDQDIKLTWFEKKILSASLKDCWIVSIIFCDGTPVTILSNDANLSIFVDLSNLILIATSSILIITD
jgi:hypothetical protein